MALALADRPELVVHVVHDERSAAFVALGLGLSGAPAVLLSTSGTAAVNFHPAVVEAGASHVPMLVVTADRPPELRDVGAPQTIDQSHLFGRSVRWFHDPGVADAELAHTWRSLARRAVDLAATGPVHLNVPFRDPLVGRPGPLPPGRPPQPAIALPDNGSAAVRLDAVRGVILAGGRGGVSPEAIAKLAEITRWPVLADPTSPARQLDLSITAFDALLRHQTFVEANRPVLIVRIGRPAASKVLAQWVADCAGTGTVLVQVGGPGVIDPDHHVAAYVGPGALDTGHVRGAPDTAWQDGWTAANARAEAAIDDVLDGLAALTEPSVARTVARHLPPRVQLVVASSMPVRDLEWFGGPLARAHANRGANGIDGVVSTALGVALGGEPTVALVGDIALVHDSGALTALHARGADLRIVVVDNDGGGIFSFLPQANDLDGRRFEQLFGTPHGTDVIGLAHAHHLDAATVTRPAELAARLATPGPTLTRIATDRRENVELHKELNAAVAAALG